MGQEIERKFLVIGEEWRNLGEGTSYRQGYIVTQNPEVTVRVRIAGNQGYLTLKGKREGIRRAEFEYSIPLEEAETLLETLCDRPLIEKKRYSIKIGELVWEVDEFWGDNQGLIMAEVELQTIDQGIDFPPWIGKEVTDDLRYYNSSLAQYPYKNWGSSIPNT